MTLSKTAETYIEFLKIRKASFADQIRFIEQNWSYIQGLPENELTEVQLHYVIALFEVGAYQKFLEQADALIEHVIKENIMLFKGKDIYFELLLNKASSHYNLIQNDQAMSVSRQLKRMHPDHPVNNLLLQKIYRRKFSQEHRHYNAFGIALYFLSGFIIAVELFIVNPFYHAHRDLCQMLWQTVFFLASSVLLLNQAWIYWKARKSIKKTD